MRFAECSIAITVGCALGALSPTDARAEGSKVQAALARAHGVTVEIRSVSAAVPVKLYELGHDSPLATCITPCRLSVVPTRYRLVLGKTRRTVGSEGVLEIDRDSRVSLDPYSYGARTLGFGLATAGTAMVLVAGILLATRNSESCDESYPSHCDGSLEGFYVGIPLLLAGLPLLINGWVYVGSTYGLDASVTPLGPAPSPAPRSATGRSGSASPAPTMALRLAF